LGCVLDASAEVGEFRREGRLPVAGVHHSEDELLDLGNQ
jgi:hypothetical protein